MPKPVEYTREQRDKAIAEVLMGASLLKAGSLVGVRPEVVGKWLAEEGLKPANPVRKSDKRAEAVAALAAGMHPTDVVERYGVSRKTVWRWQTEAKLVGVK